MSRLSPGRGRSAGRTFLFATSTLFSFLSFSSITTSTVQAQSKGPGPRAGHCVVEHNNVVYVLGGTPPVSSSYAAFTSLKLPVNGITPDSSESLPWQDLTSPPEPIQITNLTMTYSSLNPTATPNWSDCFATDDGKIVVVGGGFQLMSFDIGSNTWTDGPSLVPQVKYGPSVAPGMFLNPVYVQARILADGFTAIVVCTLNWNSQPQPYYLDTSTWTITWAIGTASTTPVGSTSAASGWGMVQGVTTPLPPAGFRHFSLAVLGQDKNDKKNHYGNGRAYMIGGYSTLVTGQVQDWDSITSFPVQQAPSSTVVMFGNSGSLSKTTRGSVAYAVSTSEMDILPGNGGGSDTVQNVETYFSGQNTASSILTTITPGTGPRNTIFRGGVEIGQGSQIFVHGGLTSLNIPSTAALTQYLDQSVAVWDGSNHQWSTQLNTFVPPKSKALPIGLGAGAAVLVLLIGLGFWIWRRKRRQRFLEEEERRVKGMAIKNEDKLQKEHKKPGGDQTHLAEGSQGGSSSGRFSPGTLAYRDPVYEPLQPPGISGYSEGYSSERGSFSYPTAELVHDHEAQHAEAARAGGGHSSQQYPMTHLNTSSGNASGYAPGQASYQSVVSAAGHPVYGLSNESATPAVVAMGVSSPTLIPSGFEGSQDQFRGPDQFRISLDSRTSLPGTRPTSTFTQQSSPYFGFYTSGSSPAAVYQQQLQQHYPPHQQQQQYQQQQQPAYHQQASPTFSNTYSLPDSLSGATHVSGGHPSGLSPALSNKDPNSGNYAAPPSMNYQTRPQP